MTPSWLNPLPLALRASADSLSFRDCAPWETTLPLAPHPGAFGVVRKHHTHEGVDLYAPAGTPVRTVEAGVVVRVEDFTGPKAGTPWWHDTQAVFVEGTSGVVVYGELVAQVREGQVLGAGELVGHLTPVLTTPKGRPDCMLHLELHASGTRQAPGWDHGQARPATLRDPTPYLLPLAAPDRK